MSDKMLAASHWRRVQRQHLRGVGENAEPILPRHRDEAARRTIAELRSCSITNVRKSDGNQVAVGNIPNGAVPEKSERAGNLIHAVERAPGKGSGKAAQFIPIRFIFTNKLSRDVKLLLAFDALVFSEAFERGVGLGKLIHGDNFATLNVKTTALIGEVRKRIEKIAAILSKKTPVDLILNRHCPECEFRDRCRQKALETDDLSLLAGMSAKERQKLRSKGIFTVTQLSYTFRPRPGLSVCAINARSITTR